MSTSIPPDYNKFFELADPLANRPLRLSDEHYSEWLSRDQAWRLFRGELKLAEPLRLGAYMGSQAADFLWAGLAHIICVSSRVIDLLIVNQVTGWSTYPVEVFDRKGQLLAEYLGFAVTGAECHRDRGRSQVVTKLNAAGRPIRVYKGLYFDESQWDGSDFFLVQPLNSIAVTEKVYRLFKRAKVTNVRLTPLIQVELDVTLDQFEKD
ncbi:MAG: hypothetical protein KatS3mg053_2180 [Candidatus Roseilinea sp.]|nr:MAG: hypothetical protein KatS3mg053_2180 [Candidatus Roseilinea sp.]